ncbi:MAG: aminoacyl-tRNA hydrolase [Methyloceanibacter sp.]|uniref:aminoacyl-tRNA hydrolase n=1 Tax=Methyloceanibacter sp. TaxID=1965321 RepID=UPI003D6CFA84
MKLFVGLGNPGAEYAFHRHNVGFMALDAIAASHDFPAWRKRFSSAVSEGRLGREQVLLLKPQTYMNDSGRAVGEAVRFYKLDLGDVIAFHDEIDLAPGKVRVKAGGGVAGHNGLKSLTSHIGNDYVRVRIGVGHPGHRDQVVGYVLHDFAKADYDWLEPLLGAIAEAAPYLADGAFDKFQTQVAHRAQAAAPEKKAARAKPARKEKKAPAAEDEKNAEKPAHEGALAGMLRRWLGS